MTCPRCAHCVHCPVPALRAQEEENYTGCAFFRVRNKTEYSLKLQDDWKREDTRSHKGRHIEQPKRTPVDMSDYLD